MHGYGIFGSVNQRSPQQQRQQQQHIHRSLNSSPPHVPAPCTMATSAPWAGLQGSAPASTRGLSVASYNIGARTYDTFSSDEGKPAFIKQLRQDLGELCRDTDAICLQEASSSSARTPNTRQQHVPGRHFGWVVEGVDGRAARFDWVLERVDGTAARIHPSSNVHGTPVYGRMEQWAPPRDRNSAPAATRGAAVMKGG